MLTTYLPELLSVAAIHQLAVMSPGPDFAMVSRTSLLYSRRTAILTAVGLGLGIAIHVLYSLVGIGILISRSIVAFNIIKLLGAAYLIYVGYCSLRATPQPTRGKLTDTSPTTPKLSTLQAIRLGFLTNVLNPKATLFFLSLFSQIIRPATPLGIKIIYGIEMSAATALWFSLVAIALSQPTIKAHFAKWQRSIEKIFGAILIALGIKIAVSR